jgi:hypothetical protein
VVEPDPEPAALPAEPAASPVNATPQSDSWRDHLDRAIDSLKSELENGKPGADADEAKSPPPATRAQKEGGDAASPMDEARLRLLYAAADRGEEARRPISTLAEYEQDFWSESLAGMNVMLDPAGHPRADSRASLALSHVRSAAHELASGGVLEVKNLTFCSKIEGYGRFTGYSKPLFQADQEVLLYVEVDNFTSTLRTQSNQYETTLQGSYDVRDSAGRRVSQNTFPVEKDLCRNRRRDFFMWYRFYVPKANPGEYTLQVTVEDIAGEKFGQSEAVTFTIDR